MMFKNLKYPVTKIILLSAVVFIFVMSCKKESVSDESNQTILEGKATFYVDETIAPIIEDVNAVFESQYNAKIKLENKPESEVVNLLLSHKADVVFLSRELTPQELKAFKGVNPKITRFATDGIALITNKKSTDTVVDLQEVINLIQGKTSKIKKLVFENPNSSTVRYLNQLAGISKSVDKGIYSLGSHQEVLKYVSENTDVIGVVGINSILEPYPEWQVFVDRIKVMGVKNVKSKPNSDLYYKPNQSNLSQGLYPMQRSLYMLNFQGAAGLGMGFASFIAGETGQRIILKSGLLPIRIPSRNINIRKEMINNK